MLDGAWWPEKPLEGELAPQCAGLEYQARVLQLDLEGRGASNGVSGASDVFPATWLTGIIMLWDFYFSDNLERV